MPLVLDDVVFVLLLVPGPEPKPSQTAFLKRVVRFLVATQGALLSKEFNAQPTTMSSTWLCWSPAPSPVKG